jgi:serine/threonine protein kinase
MKTYDASADIYSFGVTAYFIMTGLEPFQILTNPIQILMAIRKGFFVSGYNEWRRVGISQYEILLPSGERLNDRDFLEMIERCLSLQPKNRPSPDQLVKFLEMKIVT